MNLSIITAQIISQPQLVSLNKKNILYMMISVPNDQKKLSFFNILAYGVMNKGYESINLYQKKDVVLVVGDLYIRKNKNKLSNMRNYLLFEFYDVQLYLKNLA